MSDDLDMKALSGDLTYKTELALYAGCDIALQCSGVLKDSLAVAKGSQPLSGAARRRALIADYCAENISAFDASAARDEFESLMAS